MAAAGVTATNTNKKVTFKNCAPFSDCIIETNNTQINDAQKIDVVMPMYNLIECSDTYSETSGNWWQYYRDEPATSDNVNIILFPANNNNTNSFKFKQQITENTRQETVAEKILK